MRIERRDGTDERRILISMIVDRVVLARVASLWTKEGLFQSKWSNIVGGWCVKFFNKFDEAPGSSIEGLFERWSENKDKETVKLIERFLTSLSGEYERLQRDSNSDFVIDSAGVHFNKVRIARLKDALEADLDSGDLKKAEKRLNDFGRIEMGVGAGVDVLNDMEAVRTAFTTSAEPLFYYPDPLQDFFRDSMARDSFVAVMAPEKRGKTFTLIDFAWMAMMQRRKVAFFACGDLSQNQMMKRFAIRAAKRPWRAKKILFPKKITRERDEAFAKVEHEERTFKGQLGWKEGWKAFQKVSKDLKTNTPFLKLSCHPTSSISIAGIEAILKSWERSKDEWTPDVVIIDYADILAPPAGMQGDSREAINTTWKKMRSMSQSRHNLVITATQADAASYDAAILRPANFSEDKRKLAHVTAIMGLNQTPSEKEEGVMRLNWLVLREDEFSIVKCVHVAGCLAIGRPFIKAVF
jgi:hypothetical protein